MNQKELKYTYPKAYKAYTKHGAMIVDERRAMSLFFAGYNIPFQHSVEGIKRAFEKLETKLTSAKTAQHNI